MAKIQVSIIVPIYNVTADLPECLDSLKRRTMKDIEVILVNEGAADASGEIAENYADKNENNMLINRENVGLSAASNMGLGVRRGICVFPQW